jgi:hypothetical protein
MVEVSCPRGVTGALVFAYTGGMGAAVPFDEAVSILRGVARTPADVRALQDFNAGTFGPRPFYLAWRGSEAEVTVVFTGGVITSIASVRIGDRFSNDHDWIGETEGAPLDTLGDMEAELFELSLRSAAARL